MRTQTRVMTSVAASLAVSVVIVFMVLSLLRDMDNEAARGRVYDEIRTKTYAMNLLTASLPDWSSPSRIHQIRAVRRSLENLLGAMTSSDIREEFLVRQIRTNSQELGYALGKLIASHLEPEGAVEAERNAVLVSQLRMKTQFISDDTSRLMEFSQSRIVAAQKKAGIWILALIVALILINAAISFFSGRSIVRMQEGVRKQREWLKVTLASIGDAVIATDMEANIAFLNPVAAALTGWPIEEALGRPVQDLFRIINEKTREPAGDIVSRVLREGGNVAPANHSVLVARDGREIPIEDSAASIKDGAGKVAGVVLVFHDVTEKRRARETLRESEERFRLFMDNSPTIAWIRDEQGRHVYLSKTFEKRFGVRLEDWRGRTDAELWPAGIAEEFRKNDLAVLAADQAIEVIEETVNPDGSRCYWLNSKFPFCDTAGNRLVAGIGLDITAHKRAEEALQRAHDELETKVAERTAELAWKNRELEDFASVASHDLQEPLRKIQAFGDMLQHELSEDLPDSARDRLSRVMNAAARMQELIRALLTYSRVSTRATPFDRLDLGRIAREVVQGLEVRLNEAGAVVKIGDLPVIDADPLQMSQLLQNLVVNALKYSQDGQAPVVKISGREISPEGHGESRWCELHVEDNGIGFDMHYLDKIFRPFERLHGRHEYEGTGMGLAICSKIAERHGGRITAQSRPGEGAAFIVTLPMRQTGEPRPPTS